MWVDQLRQDVRYTFRTMTASPWFTATAVLVLAIGIGATVAAFSAFNMVALRPLPVRDPDTLVRFQRQAPTQASTDVPLPAVEFYRANSRALSAVIAQMTTRVTLEGAVETPVTAFVSANYFDELGARPLRGRLLGAPDARPEAPPAVVLGYGFWTRQFGADPAVVGTSVRINGRAVTVAGVAEREFPGLGGNSPALWALLEQRAQFMPGLEARIEADRWREGGVTFWGRLAPGRSRRTAEDELSALAAELRRAQPAHIWEGERLVASAGGQDQVGSAPMLAVVVVLVVLILIAACGNLGSLLMARGAARRGEMALRMAIGAGAGRLIRQLFTESLVLAGLGCFAGLLLGTIVLRGLMAWTDAPAWLDPTPDWRVVAFAAGISVLSALVFGLLPARHLVRRTPPRRAVVRTALIGAQITASCVLLVVAGLLVRAVERASTSDPGFEYEHVVVVEPSLVEHGYNPARAREYMRALGERVSGISGVEATSVTSTPPLGPWRITAALEIDGRPVEVFIHQVDERFLSTMKIPLLRGRNLDDADRTGLVVGESFARRYWPGRDPLGQPFRIGKDALTVVGVAASARPLAPNDPDALDVYRVAGDADAPGLALVARTSAPTATLLPAIAAAANGVDANVRPRLQLLKDAYLDRTRDVQRGAIAVSVLGVIALAVACLGVAGLVAYSVAQRTKDIGIRIALGAGSRHIVQSLVGQYLWTIAGGLLLGVVAAGTLAQLLRRELYGVSAVDPLAYVGAVVVFMAAMVLASIWPVRRALGVDPLIALRRE